jgi:glutathione synthase/RimK-type ligase-like ATP-grasp enzyme
MARRHWQIYQWRGSRAQSGRSDCLRVQDAPRRVVKTALKLARLIGDGFYGVDLKEIRGKVVVMEINDNPSVDAGCEDEILGQALYDRVADEFLRRLDSRHVTAARR